MVKPYVSNLDSRAFIQRKKANFGKYYYHACSSIDGMSQSHGETSISYSFDSSGKRVEAARIKSVKERPTANLISKMPNQVKSILYELSNDEETFDIQLHWGNCYNPSVFNEFDMALVLEDVIISNYGTDRLVALSPDESAIITETVSISVGRFYYIKKLEMKLIGGSTKVNGGIATHPSWVDYLPYNMDLCETEHCKNTEHCTMLVLAVHRTHAAWSHQRMYASIDGGESWTHSIIPNTIISSAAPYPELTTVTCFEDYTYVTVTEALGRKKWIRSSTNDIVNGNSNWTVIMDSIGFDQSNYYGNYFFKAMTYDNKIIKFRGDYYTCEELGMYITEVGSIGLIQRAAENRNGVIVKHEGMVMGATTPVYVGDYSSDRDTPIHLRKYKEKYIYCGISILGHQHQSIFGNMTTTALETRPVYFGISEDGVTWDTKVLKINGAAVQITNVVPYQIRPYIISEEHWILDVTSIHGVESSTSIRRFVSLDGGKSWKEINWKLNKGQQLHYVRATDTVWFSSTTRTYDMFMSEVTMPDGDNDTYRNLVTPNVNYVPAWEPTVDQNQFSLPYTCKDNPNLAFMLTWDGLVKFS